MYRITRGPQDPRFEVTQPQWQPLATLMVSDALNFGDVIAEQLRAVQAKEVSEDSFTGNICSLHITAAATTIVDELSVDAAQCTVATDFLAQALRTWLRCQR